MTNIRMRHASPRQNIGPCGWPEGEPCDYEGPLVKGLCPPHYNRLTRRLLRDGIRRNPPRQDDRPGPLRCVCPAPRPELARIFNDRFPVADAFECQRCFRAVLA